MPASDKTALQCVMEVDEERLRLEKMAEELVACEDDGKCFSFNILDQCIFDVLLLRLFVIEAQEQLMDIYERLDDISADTAEARAAYILHGLGFTTEMQKKKTRDFSGECA